MKNNILFISPTYNASNQLKECYESLKEQLNKNWKWVILNDMSTDDTGKIANKIIREDDMQRVTVVDHQEKKYALKGIYDYIHQYVTDDNTIICILDGDDALCNENTVDLVLKEYDKNENLESLWTAHSWDIKPTANISRELPEKINPYQYPWVTSHMKTFKSGVFKTIPKSNFRDLDNNWFKRGYDQALYLPILFKSKERKFLNEVCYLYKIISSSIRLREIDEESQLKTVKLVRARGYVE